jgi:hypothetical protein
MQIIWKIKKFNVIFNIEVFLNMLYLTKTDVNHLQNKWI